MVQFGETSWDDDSVGGSGKKFVNSKDLWLHLDDGENEVRLITAPHQYLMHRYKKTADEAGFGQKVYCASVNGGCPLCKAGDKAKRRWLVGVISRKDNTYKVLDISYSVFSQIQQLNKNVRHFGDPSKYDINIQVNRKATSSGYYSVQALPKEPLSAADQVIRDTADLAFLKSRVTPPTAEEVQKRLDKLNGLIPDSPQKVSGKEDKVAATKIVAPVSTDDDDDGFPAYDGDAV